jgi:hypothetical protein
MSYILPKPATREELGRMFAKFLPDVTEQACESDFDPYELSWPDPIST